MANMNLKLKAFLLRFPTVRALIFGVRKRIAPVAVALAGERLMNESARVNDERLELENYRLRSDMQRMQSHLAAMRDSQNRKDAP